MTVDCMVEDPRWEALEIEALAETAICATLERLGLEPSVFEVSLMVCDDARISALNADFRGKPTPTNVLSWPSEERGAETPGEMPHPPAPEDFGPTELGDIALAYDTCVAEAAAADKPLADHATHLLVHGTLHLLGFDHIREADAVLMEGLETEILGKLGLADPYSQA
ncbi:MAG: rRNA maturation RNase YbeY [Limimaricola sp.]|uniref:rRNA maturation RNase YbeY n=1 Tax=Limimaricola sp. TaxID=2211665 RepID=UPI001D98402B|nr:rRNA maturation RNase YbeY [Limimaricola sp.]MBI1415978.1 rRNA maturation RNase YbeY [Limimaricola sp.]